MHNVLRVTDSYFQQNILIAYFLHEFLHPSIIHIVFAFFVALGIYVLETLLTSSRHNLQIELSNCISTDGLCVLSFSSSVLSSGWKYLERLQRMQGSHGHPWWILDVTILTCVLLDLVLQVLFTLIN